ncbi:MAG: hypothetical protein WC666_01210 [Candidatus Paceibacterota bacterium]|jgi:hypothetical protein
MATQDNGEDKNLINPFVEKNCKGPRWKAYREYLERKKKAEETQERIKSCEQRLHDLLQEVGDEEMKKFYPGLQIAVTVRCSLIPRC